MTLNVKFKYYADLYLKLGKSEWKLSTYCKNKGIVKNRLNVFFDLDIYEIKPSVIRLWLNSIQDVSNKSKKHYLNSLSMILKLALEDEIIDKNPIIHIKSIVHKTPRIEPFTSQQVNDILRLSTRYNDRFQIFLYVGFFTGMRTGEILSLKMKDVDLENRVININSTRSRFGENTPKPFIQLELYLSLIICIISLKNMLRITRTIFIFYKLNIMNLTEILAFLLLTFGNLF